MKFTRPAFTFLLAVLGFALWTPMPGQAGDDGLSLALAPDITGKNNINGRGGEFAPELYRRLTAAGGEAHLVVFTWRRSFESPSQDRSCNAVVFRDAEGRYWAMDMYMTKPVWVSGNDPQKWLDHVYPKIITRFVSSRTDSHLAGQYADLSRKDKAVATTPAIPATTLAPTPLPATAAVSLQVVGQ